MLTVGNGVVAWSSDPLTTTEKVDTYATARGWSDWADLTPERKAAAVLDASTYARVLFYPPNNTLTATITAIEDALAEAARLSLTGPLIGGSDVTSPQVLRERVGPIEVEYAEAKPNQLRNGRLALVNAMLRAAGARALGGVNVSLSRA